MCTVLHVIMHQSAELHRNRSTCGWIMTSYRFFKMATAATQYYFRFWIGWRRCLEKVKICQSKFHKDNSIHGWDITSSGLEKLSTVILEFYFRFRLRPYLHNRNVILHQPAKFHRNTAAKIQWTEARRLERERLESCGCFSALTPPQPTTKSRRRRR